MAKQTFTTGSVLTATQMNNLQANDYNWTVSQKTASYVLVASDVGTRIEMNSGSATTVTVNTGIFAAGDTLFIQNIGAGVCTVTAGTATVNRAASASLALAQWQGGYLYFISASSAVFFADAGYTPPLTTKGDLFTFDTANTRLPIGTTNGHTLQVDSTAATGMKWAASGSYTQIATQSLNGIATHTFSSIPTTYKKLRLVVTKANTATANQSMYIAFNSQTGGGYYQWVSSNRNGSQLVNAWQTQTNQLNVTFDSTLWVNTGDGTFVMNIEDGYAESSTYKVWNYQHNYSGNSGSGTKGFTSTTGWGIFGPGIPDQTAISSITIYTSGTANFTGGTATLFGIN